MEIVKDASNKERQPIFAHFVIRKQPDLALPNDRDRSVVGNATVAMVDDGIGTHYGVSFCSPSDQFCRKVGRSQAVKRLRVHMLRLANGLDKSKFAGTFDNRLEADDVKSRLSGCNSALASILNRDERPSWLPERFTCDFRGRNRGGKAK